MVLVVESVSNVSESTDHAAKLRCIDTDVHNDLPSFDELKPFIDPEWLPWIEHGVPPSAARYYANMGSGRMDDAVREEDDLCAGDPEWTIQQLMTRYRIDIGVLTGTAFGLGIQQNERLRIAIARAYNDWTLAKWIRPYPCFKGSIVVPAQSPQAAAAEIH